MEQESSHYMALGVSAAKGDVHKATENLPTGLFSNSFCRVTQDIFSNDPNYCVISHADGAGTKSILAYLHYMRYGDVNVFKKISQDAIVMNLDDMLCAGATTGFSVVSIVNRHAKRIDDAVLKAIVDGFLEFIEKMNALGISMVHSGGETADVGDIVSTLLVDSVLTTRMLRKRLIANEIQPGHVIVALASDGQPAKYEEDWNSGIGSNGITFARHALLNKTVSNYQEVFDKTIEPALVYRGPFGLEDKLPNQDIKIIDALLSPTRTYAPIIDSVLKDYFPYISGLIHNSGGGQLKCLKFGQKIHYVKTLEGELPLIFKTIKQSSQLDDGELARMFNLGYRMEIYCEEKISKDLINIASHFGISAKLIGYTKPSATENNCLTLKVGQNEYHYSC